MAPFVNQSRSACMNRSRSRSRSPPRDALTLICQQRPDFLLHIGPRESDGERLAVKTARLMEAAAAAISAAETAVSAAAEAQAEMDAAIAAWQLRPALAVALWLVGRVADGLDGAVARSTDRSSDAGGLLDFVFDSIGYAAIPIGLAFGIDDRGTWIATAVLLATFYVNSVALGYVSALLEKRSPDTETLDRATSAIHPRGLVEGAETIVFFAIALAFNKLVNGALQQYYCQ